MFYLVSQDSAGFARRIAAILRQVRLWRQRARERALLARFDSRMLRDIGITLADAAREINRPFWKE